MDYYRFSDLFMTYDSAYFWNIINSFNSEECSEEGYEEAVIIKVEDVDTREELPSVDRRSLPPALM